MTLFNVKPGDPISAESMNRVIAACNPQVGDGRAMPERSKGLKVTWKNNGQQTFSAGQAVPGVWRGAEADAETACRRFLREGATLEGPDTGEDPSDDKRIFVTLKKTAAPGKIVPADAEGLVFSMVQCSGDDRPSAAGWSADEKTFTTTEAGFSILAASAPGTRDGKTYRFCAMIRASGWRCWFTNESRWTIAAGEMVGVVGLTDSGLSSEEAINKWKQEGLRLRVKRIGLIDDANAAWLARGVALDDIPPGETGRGTTTDLFAASVWRDPAVIGEERRFLERADWRTTDWTDPQGVSRRIRRLSFVKYPGDFTVVDAAAPDGDGNVFSLVTPAPAGPAVDRITSVDVSAGTAEMACGVTATSPLASLTADDAGRKALLFRNSVSRAWQVILSNSESGGTQSGGESEAGDQSGGD